MTEAPKQLLVVDDRKEFCLALSILLPHEIKDPPLTVLIAGNYGEAHELITSRVADKHPIDLMVGDLSLPGNDLWWLISILANDRIYLPIVIFSGYEMNVNPNYYKPGGPKIIKTLRKPLQSEQIVEAIRTCF